ncbi:MAG: ZIP family metal transporter [Acidobacteriota bacterium]|nr:MAG: ZIP family metal transporter [Acidobacteriota bacterium]
MEHTASTVLLVMLVAAIPTLVAGVAFVPLLQPRGVGQREIAAAFAFASGLMLGGGYLLLAERIASAPVFVVLGACFGAAYTFVAQRFVAHEWPIEQRESDSIDDAAVVNVMLQSALHAVPEGVAIGVAMAVRFELGLFVALALAVHNVAEGTALAAALRRRGLSLFQAAMMCILSELPQPMLAVAAFLITSESRARLALGLGVAAGALIHLVLTELLPICYRQSDRRAVALLVSGSTGLVVLLKGFLA